VSSGAATLLLPLLLLSCTLLTVLTVPQLAMSMGRTPDLIRGLLLPLLLLQELEVVAVSAAFTVAPPDADIVFSCKNMAESPDFTAPCCDLDIGGLPATLAAC
jgi:hypothetical protein